MQQSYEGSRSKHYLFSDAALEVHSGAGIAVSSFFFILLLFFALIVYAIHKLLSRQKGLIIPLFEAPKGFSPAGAGFVLNGFIDEKLCMASLINMKEKGFLTITKEADGYTLNKWTERLRGQFANVLFSEDANDRYRTKIYGSEAQNKHFIEPVLPSEIQDSGKIEDSGDKQEK